MDGDYNPKKPDDINKEIDDIANGNDVMDDSELEDLSDDDEDDEDHKYVER